MDLLEIIEGLDVKMQGVIHVGAADGDEYPSYIAHGLHRQVWIEPQRDLYEKLCYAVPHSMSIHRVNAACGRVLGKAKMYILGGNRGHSSSLLLPKKHAEYHPDNPIVNVIEVNVIPLDAIMTTYSGVHDLLVIDTQGYELEVLEGARKTVPKMNAVICEVNQEEMYKGCPNVKDIDAWLGDFGFERAFTDWCGPNQSYGDGVYVRRVG